MTDKNRNRRERRKSLLNRDPIEERVNDDEANTNTEESKNRLSPINDEYSFRTIEVQHLIKYNLYLLTKSIIFHAVVPDAKDHNEAVEITNNVIQKLDLANKPKE